MSNLEMLFIWSLCAGGAVGACLGVVGVIYYTYQSWEDD